MKTRRTASKKPGLDEAAGLSDQELVPFFELALDLLCIAGTDGYFKRVNPAFERTLGYSEAELLGRPFLEFVHEDDQICTMREMEKLGSGQNTVFFSNRYRHRNGGYRWIEWNAAPDPKGARIYAAARDITERRRSEERFRQVVSAAPNGILMMTRRGEVVLSNPRAEVITGLPSGELKGRHLADFLPRLERKHVMQTMQSCLHLESDDPPPNSECLFVCADGTMVPVRLTFSRVESGEGEFVLVIIVDLSERRRAERELRQSAEQIKRSARELHEMRLMMIQAEKMDSMGRLAAGVAHEVKNPLAMIQLGVEWIEKFASGKDERARQVLQSMQGAVERANRIVNEMLDISSDRRLAMSPGDINELARECLLLCRHDLIKAKIETREDFAPSPLLANVDRSKILQVLINLVINSIHAMEGGGVLTLRTECAEMGATKRNEGARTSDHLRAHDKVVVISVEDSGSGIPESVIHRVFEPFFTTKPTGKGTGLGLAVARSIIELHRGVIDIKNRKPGGTVVTVSLPALVPSNHTHECHEKQNQ